jgi:hypothetical protein
MDVVSLSPEQKLALSITGEGLSDICFEITPPSDGDL